MDNPKKKLFFIITTTRSLSTITWRIIKRYPGMKSFNDSITHIKIDNEKEGKPKEEILKKVEKMLKDECENYEMIFLKEINHAIYFDLLPILSSKYDMKIMYLVRHPKPQFISLLKAINREIESNGTENITEDLKNYWLTMNEYEILWDLYKVFPGKIVITEQMQENPQKTFKEIYDFFNLEWSDSYLTFPKVDVESELSNDSKKWVSFYSEAINSTEFKTSKIDVNSIILDNIDYTSNEKERILYYDNLLKESQKK